MSDIKSNVKKGIDGAAEKLKDAAGKAIDKSKEAATAVGKKTEQIGQSIQKSAK